MSDQKEEVGAAPSPFECDPLRCARERAAERLAGGSASVVDRRALAESTRQRLKAVATQPPPPWREIGPRPLEQRIGSATVEVSGRAAGIAPHSDGKHVYLAAANGGVWRSEDGGGSWVFTMASFDLDPQAPMADTLACGAIAVSTRDPARVHVGTGEAATGAYLGVGPLVTTNKGGKWTVEDSDPPLLGKGFYVLAVSPDDHELVLGATTAGLYRRTVERGTAIWRRVSQGETAYTSVVAGRHGGAVVFYAVPRGGPVEISEDGGETWHVLGSGFPDEGLGRISLALSGDDGGLLYALVADGEGAFQGLYLLERSADPGDEVWHRLAGAPTALFSEKQGDWDQAIAVDPKDPTRFFLGGSTVDIDNAWMGAVYRCRLDSGKRNLSYTFVGLGVHADIQALAFEPGSSETLWLACDGGLFLAENSAAVGRVFASRNHELATMTLNHIGQHPTEEEIYCGSQDNGCVRYDGESQTWHTVLAGDAAYPVVHWADPRQILVSMPDAELGYFRRGESEEENEAHFDFYIELQPEDDENQAEVALFNAPLVGTPPPEKLDAANLHRADRVAFGSTRPWLSDDFGASWYSIPNDTLADDRLGNGDEEAIRSLCFASFHRLYAGTMAGGVFRYDFDREERVWKRTALSAPLTSAHYPETAQSFRVPITDIAVDPADPSGSSIYVTLGGQLEVGGKADHRRLWHYNGKEWKHRSGSDAGQRLLPVQHNAVAVGPKDPRRLLPVQHNAVAVDPKDPRRLWVGADIGVWYSVNEGQEWIPFQTSLPDAAVIDLKLHRAKRLLRAATHGRGAFEISIDF